MVAGLQVLTSLKMTGKGDGWMDRKKNNRKHRGKRLIQGGTREQQESRLLVKMDKGGEMTNEGKRERK